uniref:Uncharacterized protein n=1 Tax=Cacopsylla melanoneura TaxID=428564 RepID=A0A8D8RQ76_9HEMI
MIPRNNFEQFTLGEIITRLLILFGIHQLRSIRIIFSWSDSIVYTVNNNLFILTLFKRVIVNARDVCPVYGVVGHNILQCFVQSLSHLSFIFACKHTTSYAWYCNQGRNFFFLSFIISMVQERCHSSVYHTIVFILINIGSC